MYAKLKWNKVTQNDNDFTSMMMMTTMMVKPEPWILVIGNMTTLTSSQKNLYNCLQLLLFEVVHSPVAIQKSSLDNAGFELDMIARYTKNK